MVAVVRELPTTGYALEVDGRLKTEFETREGARSGAEELKKRFPMLRVKVYDAETKIPKKKSNFHKAEIQSHKVFKTRTEAETGMKTMKVCTN